MKLTRRGLFTFMSLAPAAAIAASNKTISLKNPPDSFEYRGYKIFWTGWKTAINNCYFAGQWVAYERAGSHGFKAFYANSGGVSRAMKRGDEIDLTAIDQSRWAEYDKSPEELSEIRQRTLEDLIRLLHKEAL